MHRCGVVMAADGGEHRQQKSQEQDSCRRTIGAPRSAEPARATRPTATHQGTQPGGQLQVEKHQPHSSNSRSTNNSTNKGNQNNKKNNNKKQRQKQQEEKNKNNNNTNNNNKNNNNKKKNNRNKKTKTTTTTTLDNDHLEQQRQEQQQKQHLASRKHGTNSRNSRNITQ